MITGARDNDRQSVISPTEIAALWNRYADGLGLLIRARCATHADDIVQEAFLRLARQASLPDDTLAWLARTARNLAIDQARSDRRRKAREQRYVETQARWFEADSGLDVSADELMRAMQSLNCEEHEIVVAHLWNGMSFRQIGLAFKMSSTTTNRRYQQALDRLRSALAESSARKPSN